MLRRSAALAFVLLIAALSITGLSGSAQLSSDATPVGPEPTTVGNDDRNDDQIDADSPQPVVTPEQVPSSLEPAGQYCLLRGGLLIERYPFARIDSVSPVALAGSRWFCEFTGSPEADPPSSRISISLSTLYSSQPTLAGVAYLSAPSMDLDSDSNALAESYCSAVGGSSRFGSEREGSGGWASDVANAGNTSISICMFPDGSAIDDWGLYYRSIGTIRGTDLQDAFRHEVDPDLVEIFTTP